MRIQPRQHLLEIWRAVVAASVQGEGRDRAWNWGGRVKPNSISDAEQLLCLLYPAAVVPGLQLAAQRAKLDSDIATALKGIGDDRAIRTMLLRCIGEYLRAYRHNGVPIFSGGSYFAPNSDDPSEDLTPDQRALDVVDSYSMSVTLSLTALAFLRDLETRAERPEAKEWQECVNLANERLTAAMVGLLRSFAVNVFEPDSGPGRLLRRNINQSGMADQLAVERLQQALTPVRAALLTELNIGSGIGVTKDLEYADRLFEVGWSWGVVKGAPPEVLGEKASQTGVAQSRPYLYFTSIALDGVEDLFSERTRVLGLLNRDQQRLANALQLRHTLVRQYWSTVALFGHDKWPVEDIPWTTSDGEESDYFSLLVTSIALEDLAERGATESDLRRIYRILADLAARGRITRRPSIGDESTLALHSPGFGLSLREDRGQKEPETRMRWYVSNYSALLLKRTVRIAELAQTTELRKQLLELVSELWEHLLRRRLRDGPGRNLWDQTADTLGTDDVGSGEPSWYMTERVVECLVSAADVVSKPPLRSDALGSYSADLLAEAEHLYDKEMLATSSGALRDNLRQIGVDIERARSIQSELPGSAASIAISVLSRLHEPNRGRRGAEAG